MDWGHYVIVASIIWPGQGQVNYHPSTRFDETACMIAAREFNAEILKNNMVGFATCMQVDSE